MLSAVLMTCVAFATIGALTTDTADVAALAFGPMDVGGAVSSPIPEAQPRDSTTVDDVSQGPAPDFTLVDLDGNQISLGDFAGQPVVINFWATWCPPCQDEMPLLAGAYEREGGQVVFLANDAADSAAQLWVRQLDSFDARPISGTKNIVGIGDDEGFDWTGPAGSELSH